MANDRETKSYEVKPERPQDSSAAIRAADTGERLTRGEAGGTMSGNMDADLRPHGEAGSSGVGLPPMPDNDARIHTREESGGGDSGGGSGGIGASGGGSTGSTSGSSPD